MKSIILAAGAGSRMKSRTQHNPKCMIPYCGQPIIDYKLRTFNRCGISDLVIINGYKSAVLEEYLKDKKICFVTNSKYQQTNMVYSLFCAEPEMNDDLIISYGDIIYSHKVLNQLLSSKSDFTVIVDKKWRELWELRMVNPMDDAETMKINSQGNIVELGKKPSSYKDIEGQYIGLIKVSSSAVKKVIDFYYELDRTLKYDGQDFNNMYMTSFIQLVIDKLMPVKAEIINGGWLEFDCSEDLTSYEKEIGTEFLDL